jgi:hypothetical protein
MKARESRRGLSVSEPCTHWRSSEPDGFSRLVAARLNSLLRLPYSKSGVALFAWAAIVVDIKRAAQMYFKAAV